MMNDEMRFCSSEELQEFMAADGTRLVWSAIHKFGKGISMEDAYQESCIAVAHALAMYDPTRERTKKTTYVYQAVYNQIKMMIRHDTTLKRTLERNSTSVEVHVNVKDSGVTTEDDIIERISMEDRVNALRGAIREAELSMMRWRLFDLPWLMWLRRTSGTESVPARAMFPNLRSQLSGRFGSVC